ncbi:glutamate--tRNA ligase [Candidatus Woesearchaeota archaeon CG10_big_fil_rev_8_21_14_0_10_45_16]|nr:MAG: glutamate--tRNA ligase [Candidatus Woesearchaeota archaeon CG10_big_fil_rev_8_21_14_0_10_45_16]
MNSKILTYVLKNALDFNGSVNPKAVLGMVLRDDPSLKGDVPGVLKDIEKVITEIKPLNQQQIKEKLQKLSPELLEEKEEVTAGPLKALPNAVKGKVVVRIAPSPSGALHIGHAYGAALNALYADMYDGKFILRIEDTNPENIYPKAYELIPEDGNWITGDAVTKTIVQSERLGMYYDCAEKMVAKGQAYVCTCDADEWREKKNKGEACPCRDLNKKEQQQRYAKMFSSYAEGEAVLRLKTDIKDKNPAMRDFAIMRVNEHIHPKTKKEQRVWPLMVFSVAVDDHDLGITHVLNGKDHADNAKKEMMIMDCFGWKHPEYKHWGRINFEGFDLSTSKTRLAIEQGEYTGWDDIKLPFLPALRKRGYQPEAFRKFAAKVGLSLNDKTVSKEEFWKMINAFNREIIEPKANRYFAVVDPVKVKIEKAPSKKAMIDLHPDFPQRGKRVLEVKGEVYLMKKDLDLLVPGKIHRLMDYCNVEMKGKKLGFVSEAYEEYKNSPERGAIIHWVPVETALPVEIMMDNGVVKKGFGENSLKDAKKGDIVQLERQFFARVDKKGKDKVVFWHLHA